MYYIWQKYYIIINNILFKCMYTFVIYNHMKCEIAFKRANFRLNHIFPYRIQWLCQPDGLRLLRRPDTHLGTNRPADTFHPGSALLRVGACHYRHGDQQVGRTLIKIKKLHFLISLYDGWVTRLWLTAICQSFIWQHRCSTFVSLQLDLSSSFETVLEAWFWIRRSLTPTLLEWRFSHPSSTVRLLINSYLVCQCGLVRTTMRNTTGSLRTLFVLPCCRCGRQSGGGTSQSNLHLPAHECPAHSRAKPNPTEMPYSLELILWVRWVKRNGTPISPIISKDVVSKYWWKRICLYCVLIHLVMLLQQCIQRHYFNSLSRQVSTHVLPECFSSWSLLVIWSSCTPLTQCRVDTPLSPTSSLHFTWPLLCFRYTWASIPLYKEIWGLKGKFCGVLGDSYEEMFGSCFTVKAEGNN